MWCGEHQLIEPLPEPEILATEPTPAPKRGRKKNAETPA